MAVLEAHGGTEGRRPGRHARSARSCGSCPRTWLARSRRCAAVSARRTDPDPPHARDHRARSSGPARTVAGSGSATARPAPRARPPGRPVGGRRPSRPLVRAGLVARRRRPAGLPHRPGHLGRGARRPFTPPADLDPFRALEEQLSQGWQYQVEVVIDAPLDEVRRWVPRSLGHAWSRSTTTDPAHRQHREPDWYATEIAESLRRTGSSAARSCARPSGTSGSGCWTRWRRTSPRPG